MKNDRLQPLWFMALTALAVVGAMVLGGLIAAGVLFVLVILPVKLLWDWIVPDLFPGAVEQGLVAGSISWWTAAKLSLAIAFLTAILGQTMKEAVRRARDAEKKDDDKGV
jgi:hypothetical protein